MIVNVSFAYKRSAQNDHTKNLNTHSSTCINRINKGTGLQILPITAEKLDRAKQTQLVVVQVILDHSRNNRGNHIADNVFYRIYRIALNKLTEYVSFSHKKSSNLITLKTSKFAIKKIFIF